jgi:hypothetical protein
MKPFVVVIASYNNAPWCHLNLESVLNQEYPDFRVIYVDDLSTDDTPRLVDEFLARRSRGHAVEFIKNEVRVGPLENIDRAVRSCDPNEIVVLVDGDDFLAHRHVLTRLNIIYTDPDVWLTWGQFIRYPLGGGGFCAPIPAEVVSANAFRDYPFVSSHLRTFYAGMYHRIRPADLRNSEGQFFNIAGDVAQMFALHEMAGPHGKFVAEVLYRYNRENPLNDDKLDRARQVRTELEIREKARYGRVTDPIGTRTPSELCIVTGEGRSLFGTSGPLSESDWWRRSARQMRSVLNRLGYTVRETRSLSEIEDPHAIAVFDIRPDEIEELKKRDPAGMLNLILWKDPISAPENYQAEYHRPFGRIYTWCDDLVDNVRYFKLHLPFARPMISRIERFRERLLCTVIASHRPSNHPDQLQAEERKIAEFLADAEGDAFDLFSAGWNPNPDQQNWGIVPTNVNCLRRYRFAFCYEPLQRWNGLITAKIFDAFEAGCVPVYWGAPNIASALPSDCFIAREDFASDADLYAFLKDMSEDAHQEYLDRIRGFLASEQAVPFSTGQFVRTFVRLMAQRQASQKLAGSGFKSPEASRTSGIAGATGGASNRG